MSASDKEMEETIESAEVTLDMEIGEETNLKVEPDSEVIEKSEGDDTTLFAVEIDKFESIEDLETLGIQLADGSQATAVAVADTSMTAKELAASAVKSASRPGGKKPRCCIRKCQTVYRPGVQFFKFPTDADLKSKWLKAVKPEQQGRWKPDDASLLCQYHFLDVSCEKNLSGQIQAFYIFHCLVGMFSFLG